MSVDTKRKEYDAIEALNWSTLKLVEVSAAYARHMYDHPEERADTPAYRTGRAVHCAVLEPEEFDDRYVVQPLFSGKGMKAAKSEWLETIPEGAEVISDEDRDMALRCADAISGDEEAQKIFECARFEQTVEWEHSGIKCKGRIDALTDRVIDLKTTRHNTLEDVERDLAKYNYHAQLAWYHDGAVKAGLISGEKMPAAVVVHASKNSNFVDVAVMKMVDGTLEYGQRKYRKALSKYIGCKLANWWPGMADKPVFWMLPEWKMRDDVDD